MIAEILFVVAAGMIWGGWGVALAIAGSFMVHGYIKND
tara:strand:- start:395 stop:508 length:114 start_codon:yes stop_codon:yes gene_type:complete